MTLKNPEIFKSADEGLTYPGKRTIDAPLPVVVQDVTFYDRLGTAVTVSKVVVFVFAVGASLAVEGIMELLWPFINMLQLLTYIPLNLIRMPGYFSKLMSRLNNFSFSLGSVPEETLRKYPYMQKLQMWSESSLVGYVGNLVTDTHMYIGLAVAALIFCAYALCQIRNPKTRPKFLASMRRTL